MPAHLTLLRHNRPVDSFSLQSGRLTIGREKSNSITLADPSVSREHAEIKVGDEDVRLRDLDSSNGLKVNGVPRQSAVLQHGDRISVGSAELVFTTDGPLRGGPSQRLALDTNLQLHQTRRQALRLPDQRTERHLAAFYHLCAWVTDGVEEENGLPHWLELIGESLRAHTVQFYSPNGKLAHVHTPEGDKPRVKFAAYLLERFHALPEATAYAPRELDRFQQRLGHFHYLLAPLRLSEETPTGDPTASCPVVAVLRPADWEPFATEDRVLLQSACQLWLKAVRRVAQVHELRDENRQLRRKVKDRTGDGLIGSSAALKKLRTRLQRTAATNATVLITGETGSGKEVVAGAIHHHSPRADQAFIKVNCGAIPDGLIESELFGHVKGAFTDARSDHQGKFTLAHRGTLFLDEIGELPATAQTKLLRVLEEGLVEPLGSENPRKIDVRVIAATNRDLSEEVAARRFREDLYYRLNVITLKVPALRDHAEDLPALADHFLAAFCAENGLAELRFAPDALQELRQKPWPGNVRELRNVVQRLAVEADGAVIDRALLREVL